MAAQPDGTAPLTDATFNGNGNANGNSDSNNESLPTTERPPIKNFAQTPPRSSVLNYLKTEISLDHADIPIIACCLVSGLCDSSAYNAWTCFVSMQTGNTIFLALGASGQPITHPFGWLKSLVSIIFFLLGCLFFSWTRLVDPKSRGTLSASFFIQGAFIIIAAALVQGGVVPEPIGLQSETGADVHFIELVPLGFLAFQSGGQIVTSRLLGFNEVPTTVLTSVYCDLASDPRILKSDNVKRNRRAAAVLAILIGGIAGGWLSRSKAGMSSALWIAAFVKIAISISWSMWKSKQALQI